MMLKSFVVLFLTVASLASTTAQTLDSQHSFTPPDDVVDVIETGYGPVAGIIGVDYRAYRGMHVRASISIFRMLYFNFRGSIPWNFYEICKTGIPFAAPPVGALRWQPPAPATAWGPTPRNAFASGPGCPQVCQNPAAACPTSTSEDCLTLDVYAPLRANASSAAAIKTEALKPVMVWIYGGRIWSGATQGTAYDSRFLANQTGAM